MPLLCTRAFVSGISACTRAAVRGRSTCPTLEPAGWLSSVSAADLAAVLCRLITAAAAVLREAVSAAARPEADSAAVQPETNAAPAGSEATAAAVVHESRWGVGNDLAGRASRDMAADDDAEVTSSWPTVEAALTADRDTAANASADDW